MWRTVLADGCTVALGCSTAAGLLGRSFAVAGLLGRRALLAAARIRAAVGCSLAEGMLAGCSHAGARAGRGSCRIGVVGCRSWTFLDLK